MPKTALLEQLKNVLDAEQVNAFSAKIDLLVEEKAEERANVILEEERVAMKDRLAKSADEFVKNEITKAREEFSALLEEEKKNYESRLVEEIKVLEEQLVPVLDKVLEEQVNTVLPESIQEKVAMFEIYQPIVVGSQRLFEEHLVPVTADADAQISKLKSDVVQLNEELEVVIGERDEKSQELVTAKKRLLLEEKGVNLTETQKQRAYELFEESTFEMMQERIDNTVTMLEEQNGLRGSENDNENKDTDFDPASSVEDEAVLEEQKTNPEPSQEQGLNSFRKTIDGLL